MSLLDPTSAPAQTPSVRRLRSELAEVTVATVAYGVHTVAFQPSRHPDYRIEDRHFVEEWELADGNWMFIGVFDGHGAGHEAVEYVVETLPSLIKASLESAASSADRISILTIENILVQCIADIDDRIIAGLTEFFPGGPKQISKLTDDEIKSIIRDPKTGNSYVQIMRARTGTTALVALIDPFKSLHVASLGDCEAVLSMQNTLGQWQTKILNGYHNASDEVEAERVRSAHPGEAECVVQRRILGLITVTRALGDTPFKLPRIYTERVLALATPPFHENYQVKELLARNLTPPYLSNQAEIKHFDLSALDPSAKPVLVLCSDGLVDLYSRRSDIKNIGEAVQPWLTKLAREDSDNLAMDLLWDALGVDSGLEAASKIIRGVPGRRVDDTTVVVCQL